MSVQQQERLVTVDDFWVISHLPENVDKRMDLIEGVIHEMAPAGWLHGEKTFRLGIPVGGHVFQNKLGHVTAAETGYILYKNPDPKGKDTVLAPDLGFITASRIPASLPDGYVPFAPDLAVEVVSPGNSEDEISTKVELYLRYGTKLVWVLYPKRQVIHVYRPVGATKGTVEFLDINGVLDGEDVLPGFKLTLRDLFETSS